MTNLSSSEYNAILALIDYANMPFLSSKMLARANGCWNTIDELKASGKTEFQAGYVDLICKVTKNYTGAKLEVKAVTGLFRINEEDIDVQFLCASAGSSVSFTHAEIGAKLTLAAGDVGGFHYHVGAGVGTGGGIKDDSLSLKVAGTGVQVGRKVGVSLFGTEVSYDFGKLFN